MCIMWIYRYTQCLEILLLYQYTIDELVFMGLIVVQYGIPYEPVERDELQSWVEQLNAVPP